MRLTLVGTMTAVLLSGCSGGGGSAASHGPAVPKVKSGPASTSGPFILPCHGLRGVSTYDSFGLPDGMPGTSDAHARDLLARTLKVRSSKRSASDALIVGRRRYSSGTKTLTFLFDEGEGRYYAINMATAKGRWMVVGDERCGKGRSPG